MLIGSPSSRGWETLNMSGRNHLITFILIILLAFILRVVLLTTNPPALNWDEISHGYNAYSILKTGQDEWGKWFPLANFRAYGDYPLPLNLYITIPFIAILGLTEFAIRLPHALLGVGTVIASYFLSLGIFKEKKHALMTMLLVAVVPWHLFTSRFVLQSNVSIFFLTTAMAFFVNRNKNKWFLPTSVLSLGLTLYSYHTTRIVTPLLFLAIMLIYRKELLSWVQQKSAVVIIGVAFLMLFFVPLPFILSNPESRARSNEVFLLNPGTIYEIEQQRNNSSYSPIITKLLYNRPVYFVQEFIKNYVQYFSPQFLFLKGGTQYQFSIPYNGILYVLLLPFYYIGIVIALRRARTDKNYLFLIVWLLIAPIPAAITKEHYAVLRSSAVLPVPLILSTLGIFSFIKWLENYLYRFRVKPGMTMMWFWVIFFTLLSFNVEGYLHIYFTDYAKTYSQSWQYGYKEAVVFAKKHYNDYDNIIVTKKYGEPHEFFLFYLAWDADLYRTDKNTVRFYQSNWYWVDRFDKFNFVNDWEIPKEGYVFTLESDGIVRCTDARVHCLLITSPNNAPYGWKKINTIKFLDNTSAFEFYEN